MPRFGYFLPGEEFGPAELIRQAPSQVTSLSITTAVTCPTVRPHPELGAA